VQHHRCSPTVQSHVLTSWYQAERGHFVLCFGRLGSISISLIFCQVRSHLRPGRCSGAHPHFKPNVGTSFCVSGGWVVCPSVSSSAGSVRISDPADVVVLTFTSGLCIGAQAARVPWSAWQVLHQVVVAYIDLDRMASLLMPGRVS